MLLLLVASSFMTPLMLAPLPEQSALSAMVQDEPSSSQYVTTFPVTQTCASFNPWILSPSNNSRTVWLGTLQLPQQSGQPTVSQIVNFTLSEKGPRCTPVKTLTNAILESIVFDQHSGRVWFTENDTLGYVNATGLTGTAWVYRGDSPGYIAIDAQDNLWLTLVNSNQIAEYVPSQNKTFTSPVPTPSAIIQGITVAPVDGTVWFAEPQAKKLGHLIPCGASKCTVQEFSPPAGITIKSPIQVVVDSRGIVWFTDHGSNQFGSFNPSSQTWTVFPVGYCGTSYCSDVLPNAISLDSQGKIWMAEHIAGRIASYDPVTGILTEYTIPSTGGTPLSWWAWSGPNNLVWFTAFALGQVGYVNASLPVPLSLTPTASTVVVRQGSSRALPVRINYQGQAPLSLGLSPATTDSLYFSGSPTPSPPSASSSTSFTISAAWNTTLGPRYLALTVSNGQAAVSAYVTVNVVDDPLPDVTLGFASIIVLGGPVIYLKRRRRKKLVPVKQRKR